MATPSPHPTLAGCERGGGASWHGTLVALPSTVPGVTIDTAYWQTDAHTFDLGAETILILGTRVRTSRNLPLDSVALLYTLRFPDSDSIQTIADLSLGPPIFTPKVSPIDDYMIRQLVIAAEGSTVGIEYIRTLEKSAFITSLRLNSACPLTVRVVRRDDLLRYFAPAVLAPARLAELREAGKGGSSAPLSVFDTTVAVGGGARVIMGVAVNRSDTALAEMVTALVLDGVNRHYAFSGTVSDSELTRDTLEFSLGTFPPRGQVLFAEWGVAGDEHIVERLVYPAATITGRPIATPGNRNRVSWVRSRSPDPIQVAPASR